MTILSLIIECLWASLMAQWVNSLPAMQEMQEMQIQSLGYKDSREEENGNPLQYSCLKKPWLEEPGEYSTKGCRVGNDCVIKHN